MCILEIKLEIKGNKLLYSVLKTDENLRYISSNVFTADGIHPIFQTVRNSTELTLQSVSYPVLNVYPYTNRIDVFIQGDARNRDNEVCTYSETQYKTSSEMKRDVVYLLKAYSEHINKKLTQDVEGNIFTIGG